MNLSSYKKNDEYYTPLSVWKMIEKYLPKNKMIWEAFRGSGESTQFLRELGCSVESYEEDFFENDHGELVVSNPPFSKTKDVIRRLVTLKKPFILILPISKVCCKYMELVKDDLKILIPKKRITFLVMNEDGKIVPSEYNPPFDCAFYCWKIEGLPEEKIVWL